MDKIDKPTVLCKYCNNPTIMIDLDAHLMCLYRSEENADNKNPKTS